MTERQKELIRNLRLALLRSGYPPIFVVNNETLEAAELDILNHLEKLGYPEILVCGKHGLLFKGCELVLEVRKDG